ncbi:Family with sequence similarity 69 member C [Porites harrisoni]
MMRLWWRRGRISGKRLLWYAFVVAFLIIVYRVIQENAGDIERQWTCEELHAKDRLIQLCQDFSRGITGGNLCKDLCDSHDLAIQDCLAHKNTTIVFSGTWRNHDIVFKTKREPHHFEDSTALIDAGHGDNDDGITTADDQGGIQELFTSHVFEHVVNELSLFQMKDLMKPKRVLEQLWYPHSMGKLTWADMSSLWLLIQRDEFIKLQLLQSMKHIPQVYGFCGRFYAVEKVQALEELTFTPFRKPMPWKKRLKIALDFLSLEKEFSNTSLGKLHHCDIQPGNFGITKDMRVVALDIDTVFPTRQMKDFLEQPTCESNKQCDFFDCVSSCNQTIHQCSRNILTNNLQVICRDILVSSWEQPGLLQRAPVHVQNKLSSLLSECASEKMLPWEQSKRKRIHTRLKKILSEELWSK